MPETGPIFRVKTADSADEVRAAKALRYEVFVRELGGDGPLVDHDQQLEQDRFDSFSDHLLVVDDTNGRIAGVYRLLRADQAQAAGGFYSEGEYDLDVLKSQGRPLLELGRSCLHRDYRGTMAMYHLWAGLANYVADHKIEVLFGVASFHGTDLRRHAASLALLFDSYLAPPDMRVRARAQHFQPIDLNTANAHERRPAMIGMPALIKAYLRLGGFVGEGVYVDHDFNTIDVCLVMDTARMNQRQKRIYTKRRIS